MIAQLGNIEFEVLDIQEGMVLSRKYGYKEHSVIEGRSKLQYVGETLKQMQLAVAFHADFCDPETRLRELEVAAGKHESLSFIMANGKYFGEFVIEAIDVKYEKTDASGNIISLTSQIILKEHVENNIKNMKNGSSNGNLAENKPKEDTSKKDIKTISRQ